jgi:predicted DNA-binding transcriptional regulator YafY
MAKQRRRPTYPAAIRLARIVWGLGSRPYGWSFEAIQRELGISERTLLRYIAACRDELRDSRGMPVIEVIRRGSGRALRIADSSRAPDSNPYRAASLYLMLTMVQFLAGTVMRDSAEDLWDRTFKILPPRQQQRAANFDRKFYAVPYAPKNYGAYDEQLDLILRSLIDQNTIRVDYSGLAGEGKVHEFDPYTLVTYRGGLYLIGFSHLYRKIINLAVERMRKVEFLVGEERQRRRFPYPVSYRPERYLVGAFGLVDGPETEVELLLLTDTASYLRSRAIHPTQRFRHRRDCKTVLTMRVRGTTELRNFILGFGPWIKVLRPTKLRREIAALLSGAASLYESKSR